MKRSLPWIISVVAVLSILATLRLPKDKTWAASEFGRLPIVSEGRFQPMDSLARNSLLQIREKQTLRLPEEKRSVSATEWLMEVMMHQEKADTRKVFRIDHPELKSLLKLPEKNRERGEDGKHYPWNQVKPSLEELEKQGKRIAKIEPAHRNSFEQSVMKLQERLFLYMRLKNTIHPEDSKNFQTDLERYLASVESGVAAFRAQQAGNQHDEAALKSFGDFATRFNIMVQMKTPLLLPPHHPERPRDEWMRIGEALLEVIRGEQLHPSVRSYAAMATAFREGKVADFNKLVTDYRGSLLPKFAPEIKKANREYFYNHFQGFYKSLLLYVVAFLFACFSWFNMSETLRRSGAWLVVIAFVVHTAALLFRMFLERRPPVTNLYSSAIFIGWGAVILGMLLERFYRDGIGVVVASALGFLTLIIAHNLALAGDTMIMLQAVLDTNFWLATHVVVVTLGYASTYVAGFLAIIYILRGLFTRTLGQNTSKALSRMVYGIIC